MGAHYRCKDPREINDNLRGSNYFCRLDLNKAYLHFRVDEQSSEIQCISTHRGTYEVNRLFQGIKTAPSEFKDKMDLILKDLENVEKYFDDIIVHGKTL